AGEDAQSVAAERLAGAQSGVDVAREAAPGAGAAVPGERLRTRRIVEAEHGGLAERVGRAEARRVVRIAFDLRRPSEMALGEHAQRITGMGQGGGEEQRPAGDD